MLIYSIFASAFIITLILIPVLMKLSNLINLIDRPDSKLKTHKEPTPIVGGLSLIIIFVLLQIYIRNSYSSQNNFSLGILFIFILGIIDDYKRLSPVPKLIAESILSVFIILTGNYIDIKIFPNILNYILTFIWIIGIMNAVNLLDIMDALASTVSLIISLTLLFINLSSGNMTNIVWMSALSGFLFAFLFFNKPPAKVYLGDSGSLLIGFILVFVSINTKYTSYNNVAFLTPLLIFGIPIYDTFFVSTVRIVKGKNPLHGSPDHLAIKMKNIIRRKGFIVFVIALLQTSLSLFSFLSTIVTTYWALSIYLVVLLILARIGFYINSIEKYE